MIVNNFERQIKTAGDLYLSTAADTLSDLLTEIKQEGYESVTLISGAISNRIEALHKMQEDRAGDEYQANANADAMTSEQFPNV